MKQFPNRQNTERLRTAPTVRLLQCDEISDKQSPGPPSALSPGLNVPAVWSTVAGPGRRLTKHKTSFNGFLSLKV